jgi:hypothetical protein
VVEVLEAVIPERWKREPYTPMDWFALQRDLRRVVNVEAITHAAVLEVPYEVALHMEWMSETVESDGETIPCVSQDDEMRALSAAMPVALVLQRVCVGMGVTVPELVQRACESLSGQEG